MGANASNLDPRPFIPTSDDEWVGKDTRLLSNKQWFAYKGHKRVRSLARHHEVFPDVIGDFAMKVNLKVEYGPSRLEMVYRGNYLNEELVAKEPDVSFPTDGLQLKKGTEGWTLILLDADSHEGGAKVHWMKSNIAGGDAVAAADTVVPYSTPFPAYSDGIHRYVFLLLHQSAGSVSVTADEVVQPFDLVAFCQKHALVGHGMAFHRAESDEPEPVAHDPSAEPPRSRYDSYGM